MFRDAPKKAPEDHIYYELISLNKNERILFSKIYNYLNKQGWWYFDIHEMCKGSKISEKNFLDFVVKHPRLIRLGKRKKYYYLMEEDAFHCMSMKAGKYEKAKNSIEFVENIIL